MKNSKCILVVSLRIQEVSNLSCFLSSELPFFLYQSRRKQRGKWDFWFLVYPHLQEAGNSKLLTVS